MIYLSDGNWWSDNLCHASIESPDFANTRSVYTLLKLWFIQHKYSCSNTERFLAVLRFQSAALPASTSPSIPRWPPSPLSLSPVAPGCSLSTLWRLPCVCSSCPTSRLYEIFRYTHLVYLLHVEKSRVSVRVFRCRRLDYRPVRGCSSCSVLAITWWWTSAAD